jgi:hypothetical protein
MRAFIDRLLGAARAEVTEARAFAVGPTLTTPLRAADAMARC